MNSSLKESHNTLLQAIVTLNIFVNSFLNKSLQAADTFSDRFLALKGKKNKDLATLKESPEHYELLAYKDAVHKRFTSCYMLMVTFLKQYLEEFHATKTNNPEEVFSACLQHNLITIQESQHLIALSKSLKFNVTTEPEITHDMIQTCSCMQNIIARFNIVS